MQEVVSRLRTLASNLAFTVTIDTNLAQYYRETNQAGKAVELYRALYEAYDPRNPTFAEGYVEGVLQALADGQTLAENVISQARDIAGGNIRYFQNRPGERNSYWTSYLQVFELSKYLGGNQLDDIKKNLAYQVKNRSTPRHDLIQPPQAGDDQGLARARNEQAVALATRFLELFDEVQLPRPFRVESVSAGGKTIAVFVDAEVTAVEGVVETNAEGDEVIILKRAAAPAAAE